MAASENLEHVLVVVLKAFFFHFLCLFMFKRVFVFQLAHVSMWPNVKGTNAKGTIEFLWTGCVFSSMEH